MKMPKFILVLFFLLATLAVHGALTVSPGGSDSNSVYNIAIVAANSVGGPTNGVTAATAASIAATNAAWETQTTTNALTRNVTNQWSRGSGRYYGPVIVDGVALPQNNGWGSVDFQSAVFPSTAPSFADAANTNSAGGIACFIGPGYGNLIYQSQAAYDLHGFVTDGSAILSGTYNTVRDAGQSGIGMGQDNYVGPSSDGNYVDDSYILAGIGNRIIDTIDGGIGIGWSCTNGSSGGSLINGWHNWMEQSGLAILSGAYNTMPGANAGSFIVSGEYNMLTNSPYGWNLSSFASRVVNAPYGGVVGAYLTNQTPRSVMIGYGTTNAWLVKSNGIFSQTMLGGATISISTFGGITNDVGNNTLIEIGPTNGTSGAPLLRMTESSTFNEMQLEAAFLKFNFFGAPNITLDGASGDVTAAGAISGASFSGDGAGLTRVKAQSLTIGSNSVAVSGNISIYLTNVDGTVYRLAAQRIVP